MKNNQYSIKDLENLTSIKAHTIRIWEQRYGLLSPKRTDTNIRFYEDSDLKRLLNINLLYSNGYKISKIAALNDQEILSQSKKIIESQSTQMEQEIDILILSIVDLNGEKINTILEQYYEKFGIERLYSKVIIPLLEKLGHLWQLNSISVGHEHFFSYLLRAFLSVKSHETQTQIQRNQKVLFFLHSDELHELSLMFYQIMFKKAGWEAVYLGAKVPFEDLKVTYDQVQPDLVVTSFITCISEEEFQKILSKTIEIIPLEKLVISGYQAVVFKEHIPEKITLVQSQKELTPYFV